MALGSARDARPGSGGRRADRPAGARSAARRQRGQPPGRLRMASRRRLPGHQVAIPLFFVAHFERRIDDVTLTFGAQLELRPPGGGHDVRVLLCQRRGVVGAQVAVGGSSGRARTRRHQFQHVGPLRSSLYLDSLLSLIVDRRISTVFGAVTMAAAVTGVVGGSALSQRLRLRWPTADPLVCAFGFVLCAPLFFLVVWQARGPLVVAYLIAFVGQVLGNLNWAIASDIAMVTIPSSFSLGRLQFSSIPR